MLENIEYYNETKILFDIIFKPTPLIWNQQDLNWCEKKINKNI